MRVRVRTGGGVDKKKPLPTRKATVVQRQAEVELRYAARTYGRVHQVNRCCKVVQMLPIGVGWVGGETGVHNGGGK